MFHRKRKNQTPADYCAEVDRLYTQMSKLVRPIVSDRSIPKRHFVVFDAIEQLRDEVNADWSRTRGREEAPDGTDEDAA